jgi:hypothetical protein
LPKGHGESGHYLVSTGGEVKGVVIWLLVAHRNNSTKGLKLAEGVVDVTAAITKHC